MTMHERIMSGKLFTDMCEGMPEERLQAKKLMKKFNDSEPDDFAGRAEMLKEIFKDGEGIWVEPPIYFCYGKHISIGAGSVVIHDIPANCIAVGNPCRVVREINEHDMEYYYKDNKIDAEDLAEEAKLRKN